MPKPRIVFVDPSKRAHITALAAAGYEVTTVDTVREALDHLPPPDGVIVELMVPETNLGDFRAGPSAGRSLALTIIGLASENQRSVISQAGGTFCRYPCPPDELVEVTKRAIPLPAA